jgi:hypothetical protein
MMVGKVNGHIVARIDDTEKARMAHLEKMLGIKWEKEAAGSAMKGKDKKAREKR